MRARCLVLRRPVQSAHLVVPNRTSRVGDVEEHVVVRHPATGLAETTSEEIHAVGSAEWQLAVGGIDQAGAGRRVLGAVFHDNSATGNGIGRGRVAGEQVVPGIVAHVVGTAGLVDAQKVERPAAVADLDADVVAVGGLRKVGNSICVNFATEDADGGRVLVMGSDADACGRSESSTSQEGSCREWMERHCEVWYVFR